MRSSWFWQHTCLSALVSCAVGWLPLCWADPVNGAREDKGPTQEDGTGLFVMREKDSYGYIDRSGRIVIPPRYAWAEVFSEGLAGVRVREEGIPTGRGKAGYINTKGEWAIRPKFHGAQPFSNGLAVVGMDKGCGFIDHSGEVLIGGKFAGVADFSEGLAVAMVGRFDADVERTRSGHIDRSGEWVIRPKYKEACTFEEGLAPVRLKADGTRRAWGFIDKKGRMVIRPAFSEVLSGFLEGWACVKQGDKWGYIDTKGDFKIGPHFKAAWDFSDGLAAVLPDHLWGFINKAGEMVIPAQYRDCQPFSEGYAAVKVRARWGFIDTSGRTVVKPQFRVPASFERGLAQVELDSGGWAYVNPKGKIVWQQKELGSGQVPANKRVVSDDEVGLTESALVKKYGPPKEKLEYRVDEGIDEMRYGLRFLLPQSQAKAPVKEYIYVHDNGDTRYFFLVEHEKGIWVVFSNVFVPPGIAF